MDLTGLRPVNNDVISDVWEGRPSLTSLTPVDTTPLRKLGVRVAGDVAAQDPLMQKFTEAKIFSAVSRPDVLGESARAVGRTALEFTVKTGLNFADMLSDLGLEVDRKKADSIRKKRMSPDYKSSFDPLYLSETALLEHVAMNEPVEIGGVMEFKKTQIERWRDELNGFYQDVLPTKPGAINEWTNRIVSGLTSVGASYAAFGIGSALTASRAAAALVPGGLIGAVAGGGAYEQGEAVNAPLDVKMRAALEVGVEEAALESIGMHFIGLHLQGTRPVSRIALDMANNGLQEFAQGVSSGTIMKMEGISKEKWSTIFKEAAKDLVAGAFASGPYAFMSYRAENKSVIGDFRREGFSDDQANIVLEQMLSIPQEEISIKGDLASALRQRGIPEVQASAAENIVTDYNLRTVMKDSPLGTLATSLYRSGFTAFQSLEIAEVAIDYMAMSTKKEIFSSIEQKAKNYQNVQADEAIRAIFLSNVLKLEKPDNVDQFDWENSLLDTADVVVKQTLAEAERRGMDPVEFYRQQAVDIRTSKESGTQEVNEQTLEQAQNEMVSVSNDFNIETSGNFGRIVLDKIERRSGVAKGNASKVLNKINAIADKYGIDIYLQAMPVGEAEGKLSADQLKSWYERHGYEFNEGSDEGVRRAKSKKLLQKGIPKLKNTMDALAYGESIQGNESAIQELKDQEDRVKTEFYALSSKEDLSDEELQNLSNLAVEGQLYREAREVAEGDQTIRNISQKNNLFQNSKGKGLFAMHNLTEEKLAHAIKKGGLAVPSLAVAKEEHPLMNFGEISLIAGKELIDPRASKTNKVFNADVYSPRYPEVVYVLSSPGLKKAEKRLFGIANRIGELLSSDLYEGELKYKGMGPLYESYILKFKFLEEKGVAPTPIKIKFEPKYLALLPSIEEHIGKWTEAYEINDNPVLKAELEKLIEIERKQIFDAEIESGATQEEAKAFSDSLMEDSMLRIFRSVKEEIKTKEEVSRQAIDKWGTRDLIKDAIKPYIEEFQSWVDANFGDIFKGDKLVSRNADTGEYRYLPHTLDNVAKIMKRRLRDGEGFNYGVPSIRAHVAKQFKSVKDIQNSRDDVISDEDFEEYKTDVEYQFDGIHNLLGGTLDSLSENLKEVAQTNNINVLDKYYKNVTPTAKQIVIDFLDRLKNMPTEYFEAKIQRVVGLNEFTAAVIPSNVKPDTIRSLKKLGLKIFQYDNSVKGDREKVIAVAAQETNILFQEGKASPRAMINVNDRVITLFNDADETSLIHELSHQWLADTFALARSGQANEGYLSYYQGVKDWLEISDDQTELTMEQQEKFASGFEVYLAEGAAPFESSLGDAFRAFRQHMLRVYMQMDKVGEPISQQARDLFARMLGSERALTEEEAQVLKEDWVESINTELDAEIYDYENVEEMDKAFFEDADIEVPVSDARKIFEGEQAYEEMKRMKEINDYLRNKLDPDYIEEYFERDARGLVKWTRGIRSKKGQQKRFFSADEILEEFNQLFPELGLADNSDIEGKPSLDAFNIWLVDYSLGMADRMNELKLRREEARTIEKYYADRRKLPRKNMSKALKGQERLKSMYKTIKKAESTFLSLAYEPLIRMEEIVQEMKDKAKGIESYQKEITDIITDLDILPEEKTKFITSIKNVRTPGQLENIKKDIYRRAEEARTRELKNKLQKAIDVALKTTKPVKSGTRLIAKYDYENSKLLGELKRINGLPNKEALVEKLLMSMEPAESENELIIRRALSLRAEGKASSVAMYSQVLNDIRRTKIMGQLAKNEEDFLKRIERKEYIDEAKEGVARIKADKNTIKTKIMNMYRKGFADTFSMMNSIFGRDFALRWDPEFLENRRNTATFYNTERYVDRSSELLGVDKKDYMKALVDMSAKRYMLYAENMDIKHEISKMDLIDIYNSIKNEHTRDRYYQFYGEGQVQELLSNLDQDDRATADYWQEEAQKFFDVFNTHNIEVTGRDLGMVDNYWMRSSEKPVDIYDDMKVQSNIPSAEKARSSGAIIPIPKNAWLKLMGHMHQAEHVRWLSRRHAMLKRIYSDLELKSAITNKYGEDVYKVMLGQLDNISLNSYKNKADWISESFNGLINNWVAAKVALNPSVFAKQLISVGNYMEDMPSNKWIQYFAEGLKDPKATFDFMWNTAPFLKARYERGYSEALVRAMEDANEMAVSKNDLIKGLTSLVRMGDISAIVFGGYPVIKHLTEQGMSVGEAVDEFERRTLKAQQSGAASGLSEFQNSRNAFARLFLAFKNTANQYLRKQVNALVSYHNGDISKDHLAKTIAIYTFVQPMLFTAAGYTVNQAYSLLGALLFGSKDDDEDEKNNIFVELLRSIAISPFSAIPFLDRISDYAVRKFQGEKAWKVFSFPLFDELGDSVQKLWKKDKIFFDYLEIIAGFQEPAIPIPTSTAVRILKKMGVGGKERKTKGMPKRKGVRMSRKRRTTKRRKSRR